MSAIISFSGDKLLVQQLRDAIEEFLGSEMEIATEYEHASGESAYIGSVIVKDGSLVVELTEPEEEEDEEESND